MLYWVVNGIVSLSHWSANVLFVTEAIFFKK